MKNAAPLFSVIIPVYNYGHTVTRAVQSVLSQQRNDAEIILIDDGSTDNSADVCRALASSHASIHFETQKNRGAAAARNQGIRLAKGAFLLFLDADDELCEGALDRVAALTQTQPLDVVIGGHLARDESGETRRHFPGMLPQKMSDRIRDYLIHKKIRISNGAIFMHRYVLDRGSFPENYRSGEDLPLFAQALCAERVAFVDEALVIVNKHADSLRHQSPLNLEQSMQLVDEIFNDKRLPKEALIWKGHYETQRALSLMRTLYLAGQYHEAITMYRRAIGKRPAAIFKWAYTRKALLACLKQASNRAPQDRNWTLTDAAAYAAAYEQWGGSFVLHPVVISVISEIAETPLNYYACHQSGRLVAVVPVWGKTTVAGNRKYLDKVGKKNQLDTGDNETVFPLAADTRITLPFQARFLSAAQAKQIRNASIEKDFEVGLARSHFEGDNKLSRKFKYNQKRALRLFQEAGGEVCAIKNLSAKEIAQAYSELFELRWGFATPGKKHLPELLKRLHNYLTGSALRMNGRIIAIQLVFSVENTNAISAAYINGGYDPAYKEHSPGSILCYINTEEAEQFAVSKNKPIRYHFGKMDADYKQMWCYSESSYRV